MKRSFGIAAMAIVSGVLSLPSRAAINGNFDAVYVDMVDTLTGWICESTSPNNSPPGDLVLYTGGAAGSGGSEHVSWPVSLHWGIYRPDVPSAGFCGSNNYTGWSAQTWIPFNTDLYLYYRDTSGGLTLLGGSPKNCPQQVGNCL
jgi:hypothetical protein